MIQFGSEVVFKHERTRMHTDTRTQNRPIGWAIGKRFGQLLGLFGLCGALGQTVRVLRLNRCRIEK